MKLALALLFCASLAWADCPGSRRCDRDRTKCPESVFVFCPNCGLGGCIIATTTTTGTTVTTTSITATTTTTIATTTSSTTSSTTTTSLPTPGDSVSFLWGFGPPNAEHVSSLEASDGLGTLFCNAWVPEIGIDNATSISFLVANGGGTGGVAIYKASDGTRVTTTGSRTLPGAILSTSAAFNIDAGTMYWVCFCSTDTNLYNTAHPGISDGLRKIQNALTGTPLNTLGSPSCSGGAPPVGPITVSANPTARSPILFLLGTNTP